MFRHWKFNFLMCESVSELNLWKNRAECLQSKYQNTEETDL